MEKMFVSTPFKSLPELRQMSTSSPISASDALQRALLYLMKGKSEVLDTLSLTCHSYKEGEYAGYYFFPSYGLNKHDVIKNRVSPSGVFVNAQTGATRYIQHDGASQSSKLDGDDHSSIYGGTSFVTTYTRRLSSEDGGAEYSKTHATLRRYLSRAYPTMKDHFNFCLEKDGHYFFPIDTYSGRVMVGFDVNMLDGKISLLIQPMGTYTWGS